MWTFSNTYADDDEDKDCVDLAKIMAVNLASDEDEDDDDENEDDDNDSI